MIFYHWTTKSNLESIKKNGLVPRRGQHCVDIRDHTPAMIFLCKEADLDFWRNCFWDAEVLIAISVDKDFMTKHMRWRRMKSAPSKMEYASQVAIPKEMIVDIQIIDRKDPNGEEARYRQKYHGGISHG